MKKLYVVDVSSMFFRAFFAIPVLSNSKGFPTNALYGFLSMTIKLLRDIKPDYLAFCFDRPDKSFRFEIYEDYKANREEMPDLLQPQVPYVRKLTELMGITAIDRQGLEADDVIGCLTQVGRRNDLEVVIVSGDKDFAQLVGPFVTMYDTMKDVKYDVQGVIDKWGVRPDQMIDYQALVGDSSDNVPGVKGIGPKGAQKLLAEFGTLEAIYENIAKISAAGLKKKLEEGREMAFLSKKLVTIRCDVDLGLGLDDLRLKFIDREQMHGVLTELEFNSFERMLFGGANEAGASAAKNAKSGSKKKASGEAKSGVAPVPGASGEITWTVADFERHVEPYSDIWALNSERGLFFGVGKSVVCLDGDPLELGRVLSRKFLNWRGFDLKEFWKTLELDAPAAPAWDHMLAAYICRAGEIKSFEEVYARYTGKQFPDLASPSALYACYLEVAPELERGLAAVHGEAVFRDIELPLVPVLYDMECTGIFVDTEELRRQSESLQTDIAELEKKIHKLAGESFNIASPKQLSFVLFEKLGLPAGKKTKTGYSTDSDVLEGLAKSHPIAAAIIDYRELTKLKSTYVDSLPQLVSKKTGKIHTRFRQAATSTGRLSSVNPNLQNIPIRTERGRLIRKAFTARQNHCLISADYSQIELRVLAHITEDPGLIQAFADDLDIHAATASQIFGVKLKDVNADLRRTAKAVNFGIAYGQGPFGLAETLGISRTEAKDIIDRYFQRFKNVREFMMATVEVAKKQGFVETLFGRRRYIDELQSKNPALKAFGERAAINAPIQGTASDLVKKAMIALHEGISVPMLLQVHDEILFECPEDEVEEQKTEIRSVMETTTTLKVPLKVNVAHGPNWDEAH